MFVKTEVYEGDGDVGGGGLEQETELGLEHETKPHVTPKFKREITQDFIPSRVRPKLDAKLEGGGGEGVLLRCPKCSITYRSRASMKNHIAVCKAGKDPGADSVRGLGCVSPRNSLILGR